MLVLEFDVKFRVAFLFMFSRYCILISFVPIYTYILYTCMYDVSLSFIKLNVNLLALTIKINRNTIIHKIIVGKCHGHCVSHNTFVSLCFTIALPVTGHSGRCYGRRIRKNKFNNDINCSNYQTSFSVICSLSLSNGADNTYIENTLKGYFSKPRHHDVDQAYKDRSMKFIHDEFKRFGLEAEYHEFHDPRVSDTVCQSIWKLAVNACEFQPSHALF